MPSQCLASLHTWRQAELESGLEVRILMDERGTSIDLEHTQRRGQDDANPGTGPPGCPPRNVLDTLLVRSSLQKYLPTHTERTHDRRRDVKPQRAE